MNTQLKIGRRELLQHSGPITDGSRLSPAPPTSALPADRRMRAGAVIRAFTYRCHAHAILANLVGPYLFNGKLISPDMNAVSMYAEQFSDGEMGAHLGMIIEDTP